MDTAACRRGPDRQSDDVLDRFVFEYYNWQRVEYFTTCLIMRKSKNVRKQTREIRKAKERLEVRTQSIFLLGRLQMTNPCEDILIERLRIIFKAFDDAVIYLNTFADTCVSDGKENDCDNE